MKQEKIENLIKRFHLKDSFLVLVIIVSVYFWINFLEPDFLKIIGMVINITGLALWWWDLDEAIKLLEKEKGVRDYEGKYIRERDLVFLKKAKELIIN